MFTFSNFFHVSDFCIFATVKFCDHSIFDDELSESDELDDLQCENFDDIGTLQTDALEYISGYIIRKLRLEEYKCEENSQTWVDQLSKGSLVKPSSTFVDKITSLE